MASEIICNTTGQETRVVLMENGRLAELLVDRGDERGFVGNVYLGRVVRVLPGMQAAFVDIGLERAAFLYVGDIYPDVLKLSERNKQLADGAPPVADDKPRSRTKPGQPPIQDLLKEGQQIVVQVAKDPIGTKGARVTTQIALPGRFMVFMPTVEHVGISRRIDKDKERRRLREFVEKHRQKGAGFIVRTVCANQPTEVLEADMEYLQTTWKRIEDQAGKKKAPFGLHTDHGLVIRAVRDLYDEQIDRMVVDSKKIFDDVRAFMGDFMPHLKERVHLYKGKEPVFDTYGVEMEISRSLGRKVGLKSGGYLVIDQTEALMAIDVNSGKFVGTFSLEETTLMTNIEAAEEVVHQLRLRNMGGIIIIDFIDMDAESNREKVWRKLDDALRKDRARTNVMKISDLGLVEMTRKRTQEGLDRYMMEECPTCRGTAVVRSRATLAYDILREVRREAERQPTAETVFVNTTPAIADMLYGERFVDLEQIEGEVGRQVVIRAHGHYHPEQYEVYGR